MKRKVLIVTHSDLAEGLAVLLKPQDNYLTEEDIHSCIAECSSSIICVNSYQIANASEDDE